MLTKSMTIFGRIVKRYVPSSSDGFKVRFSDPCVPMILEYSQCCSVILHLTKRVFIDNVGVTSMKLKVREGECVICALEYVPVLSKIDGVIHGYDVSKWHGEHE